MITHPPNAPDDALNLKTLAEFTVEQLTRLMLETELSVRFELLRAVLARDSAFQDWLRRRVATLDSPAAIVSESTLAYLPRWLVWTEEAQSQWPTAWRILALAAHRAAEFAHAVQREKMVAMQALAYGASHEINNPLANIATRAQTLLRDERHPERRRTLLTINAQAFRAFEMISDLMLFAKPPRPAKTLWDARTLLAELLDEMRGEAEQQETKIEVAIPETSVSECCADRQQILVALQALVRNSLEALQSGGVIEIEFGETATHVAFIVRDTGPGISDELLPRIFDPFFSGREAGRGLGLGLSKVWRIAELHSGAITVRREPAWGVCFVLQLPRGSALGDSALDGYTASRPLVAETSAT